MYIRYTDDQNIKHLHGEIFYEVTLILQNFIKKNEIKSSASSSSCQDLCSDLINAKCHELWVMSSNGSLIWAHCQLVVTWSHHFEISHKDKILKTANHVSQSQLIHFYYFYFA